MTLHEFAQHLSLVASQLDQAGKAQPAKTAKSLAERLTAFPNVELASLAGAINAQAAPKTIKKLPQVDEGTVCGAKELLVEFEALRERAHQSSLNPAEIAAFKTRLQGTNTLAPVVKSLSQMLGFGTPKTKKAGVQQLIKVLENSLESSWRR